jgi:hypothetical protein
MERGDLVGVGLRNFWVGIQYTVQNAMFIVGKWWMLDDYALCGFLFGGRLSVWTNFGSDMAD